MFLRLSLITISCYGIVSNIKMLNGTNRSRDPWKHVCTYTRVQENTRSENDTRPSETADSQGVALCSAYMEVIDIWLPADTF